MTINSPCVVQKKREAKGDTIHDTSTCMSYHNRNKRIQDQEEAKYRVVPVVLMSSKKYVNSRSSGFRCTWEGTEVVTEGRQ